MIFSSLSMIQINEWYELCAKAFQEEKEYFKRHVEMDPFFDVNGIFVAIDNNKIVGSVRVFRRKIYFNQDFLTLGGIGEVCTLEEYRKQGIAGKLIDRAIEYMHENGINISMLLGDQHLYQKKGWEFYSPKISVCLIDKPKKCNNIRRVSYENDIRVINSIYHEYNKSSIGPIKRNEKYYSNWIKAENKDVFVYDENGIAGYIIIEHKNDEIRVLDYASNSTKTNLFMLFIRHIKSEFDASKVTFPYKIKHSLKQVKVLKPNFYMMKLITPFKIGSENIQNTEDLIKKIEVDKYVFWEIDSF